MKYLQFDDTCYHRLLPANCQVRIGANIRWTMTPLAGNSLIPLNKFFQLELHLVSWRELLPRTEKLCDTTNYYILYRSASCRRFLTDCRMVSCIG